MICRNCQNEIEDGVQFCPVCGAQVEEAVESVPAAEEYVPEEAVVEEAAVENVPEYVPEPQYEQPAVVQKKGAGKKVLAGGAAAGVVIAIIAAVVVVAAVIAGFFMFSGSKKLDMEKYPVLYSVDDDEIKYVINGKKEGYTLTSEETGGDAYMTADGKYFFFGAEPDGGDFDLCYRKLSDKEEADNVTIVKGISQFTISPDGKTIFYVKNNDLYKTDRSGKKSVKMGKDLEDEDGYVVFNDYKTVWYENDDNEIVVSTGVEKLHKVIHKSKDGKGVEDVYLSENEKEIIFFEQDYEDDEYTIYTCGTGKNDKAEKIASKVTYYEYVDGILYYVEGDDEIFYKNGTKAPVEVSGFDNDFSDISYTYDDDENVHFYLVTEDEIEGEYWSDYEYNLYYLDGKNAKLMVEDFGKSYYYGTKVLSVGEYDDDDDEYKYTYYFRKDYDELVETDVPEEDDEPVRFYAYDDFFYTLENCDEDDGTYEFIKYKYSKNGVDLNSGSTIAEDVKGVYCYGNRFDYEAFIIKLDDEEYSIYNGKKVVEISEDVHDFLWIHKDGTMILATDYNSKNGTYSLTKFDGKNTTVFAEDVSAAAIINEGLVYYVNDDDELFANKGKLGKDTKIDDDVEQVFSAERFIVSDEEYEVDFVSNPYLYFD